MTQEDKLKMLEAIGKSGIFVAGDVVMEKNVQYEVGNVEAGGVGIQVGTGTKASAKEPKGGGRPKRTGRTLNKAFRYDAGEETNQRLQYLYQGLKALQWIRPDTELKHFISVFSGRETTCRVVWTGGINTLAELFRELVNRKKLVGLPEGESIWVMVNARFWENEGNKEFGNDRLCDTRPPAKMRDHIDLLVKIMTPEFPVERVKIAILGQGK